MYQSLEDGWYTVDVTGLDLNNNATYNEQIYYDIFEIDYTALNYLLTSVNSTSWGMEITASYTSSETQWWNVSRYTEDISYANNSLQANYTNYWEDVGTYSDVFSWETYLDIDEDGNLRTFFTWSIRSIDALWYLSVIPYLYYGAYLGNDSYSTLYLMTYPDLLPILDTFWTPSVTTETRSLVINDYLQNVTLDIYSANVVFDGYVDFEYYLNTDDMNYSLLSADQLIMNGSAYVYFNYSYEIAYDSNTGMIIYADWHLEDIISDIFIKGSAIPYDLMSQELANDTYTLIISGYTPFRETSLHVELKDHSALYLPPENQTGGEDNTTDSNGTLGPGLNIPGMDFESAIFTIAGLLILLPVLRKRR